MADSAAVMSPASSSETPISSRVIGWTVGAFLVACVSGVPWVTPLATAAPLAYYLARLTDGGRLADATLRWGATSLAMGVALVGLAWDRAVDTIPFGHRVAARTLAWLSAGGDPFPQTHEIALAAVAFAIGCVVWRGVVGVVVACTAIAWTAVSAVVVYANGYNIFEATFVALPPWTLAFLAGLIVLLEPLTASDLLRRGGSMPSRTRPLALGSALLAAALVLRVALAGPFTSLARRWTLP